ncbi:MAG: isoprenyl transferase [Haliscomenobacter sp.]|nr:isoprenyl transferase [Haliscomenobacter sp.]MBK8655059.1 isoprenyl transferase [Haliscomenobacter sp.]MBP9075465.1 isoprenyl transferase [Haliscomenobacter sp.]MBP9872425.1 isoprenyl transferase [Haliscomenobacter sp.]
MDLKSQIDINNLPGHVAIIMDGNGRWAKQHNQPRVFGHRHGVRAVREVTESAAELGIKYLTLYAFSTENWARPKLEVDTLMRLLVDTLSKEIATLNKNNIRLDAIGDLQRLPSATFNALMDGIQSTRNNSRMTLILALNYSGKWDLIQATQHIAAQVLDGTLDPESINEALIQNNLSTHGIPDPELLIRTSGERRLSNFLLWQLAYSELFFSPVFWPDFSKEHFYQAILDFQHRERRFGKISEQLVK